MHALHLRRMVGCAPVMHVRWQSGVAALKQAKRRRGVVKDVRPIRPRVAKTARQEYLHNRQSAFQHEDQEAQKLGLRWTIKSGVILERLPVILSEFETWETDMWELQARQRFEGGRDYAPEMATADAALLTMDQLLEQSPVPLASRRTAADEADDRTSLDRALDQRLILIVKETQQSGWSVPESPWQPGETIRQAAERTMRESLKRMAMRSGQPEDVAQLHFVGNCPAGWLWRTLDGSKREQTGAFGEKVFLNRAQLITGSPALVPGKYQDHLWVTKHEIGDYLGADAGTYFAHLI